jgi:hypothetical protein
MKPLLTNLKSFRYNLGGAKCVLFGWLNKLVHPCSSNNVFNNVKTCLPKYQNLNTFSPLVFIVDNLLIKKNNPYYYYTPHNAAIYERNHHVIFKLINYNFEFLTSSEHDTTINEECVSFLNCFSDSNSGHALSHTLHSLNYYLKNNLGLKVVLYKNTYESIKDIIRLFINDEKLILIDHNKIYLFEKLHIPEEHAFNITKHKHLIDEIIKRSIDHRIESIDKYKGKNIFMVKTKINSMRPEDSFEFKAAHPFFHYIDPSRTKIYDVILYLYFSESITTSFGSIYYTNMIFCNKDARIIYLYHNLPNALPYYYKGNGDEFIVIDQSLEKNERIKNFTKHETRFELIHIQNKAPLDSYYETIISHAKKSRIARYL